MKGIGRSAIGLLVVCTLGIAPVLATTRTPARTLTPTATGTPLSVPTSASGTATPTSSATCTPGFNPPPGCAYEGPTFTHTRTTPTATCPPPPAAPTCPAETTYLCRDQCMVDCFCATPTPTATVTPSPTEFFPACCFNDTCPRLCGSTATPSPSPTRSASCTGDCDGDGAVRIGELVGLVGCAIGPVVGVCLECADEDASGQLEITEVIAAVSNALDGCRSSSSPSPTPTESLGELCDRSLDGPHDGPTPGVQLVFRLTDESTIIRPGGPVESLRGSLLVSACFSPNTFFADRLEVLRFESDSVVVESGCSAIGHVIASTLYGGDTPVEFSSAVRIDGELLSLSGRGPHAPSPARRLDLQLTAGMYTLHLVAIVDSTVDVGLDIPLCDAWGFV